VQAIIMAPSRELVTQIGSVAGKLFAGTDYRVVTLIGGANVRNQIKHMREDRPQILVATPGRLAELVFRLEQVKLGNVRAVVVDEVDNMMHEPYVGEIETVLQGTPLRKMLVLASATSSDPAVAAFADRYTGQAGWRQVAVQGAAALPRTITHGLISVPRMRALEMLRKFLRAKPTVKSALVFVNEPHRVEVVCRELGDMGLVAAPLHGDSTKEDRKEIITRMRDGRLKLVVCTELAARGLDLPELTHVVNFELPTDAEHYVHRTGRCGRAGKQGLVMNFANPETKFVIRRFGKKLGIKVQDCEIRDGKVYLKNDGK
ncbi:P-loop containing nucleoside triphosphate hydrolase protein, partial [Ochromonadaceae sp. CCMP2298]